MRPTQLIIVFALAFATASSQSYSEPSRMEVQSIVINQADQTVKTQIFCGASAPRPDNEKTYLWYGSQSLMETRGGYDGKLIHGNYSAFYLNNQLKEKGRVKYGLKNKEWKYWYPDGKLKEVITWKKGVKNGPYELYNDFGQIMAKGNFKNDKLHGKFYTYGNAGAVLEKKVYRNGVEQAPRQRAKSEPKKSEPVSKEKEPAATEKKDPGAPKESVWKKLFRKKKSDKTPQSKPAEGGKKTINS